MLDLHNHVLYGLDDGCRTLEESFELIENAKKIGHTGFVATPHIRPGMFDNRPELIRDRFHRFYKELSDSTFALYLGAEHYFDAHILQDAKTKELLTINDGSYVLIEFPKNHAPVQFERVLFELRALGFRPVIAHPERSTFFQLDPDDALRKLEGCTLQLDLGSIVGYFGPGAKKIAERWLKQGAYQVAAGDLHRPGDIDQIIEPAKARAKQLLGTDFDKAWSRWVVENPRRIVENESILS